VTTETEMQFAQQFAFHFLWGLVILAAFIGWGRAAHRLAMRDATEVPDWGLLAGWGMAVTVFIGGLLNLFGWVSPGIVTGVVGIGGVMFMALQIRHPPTLPSLRGWGLLLAAVIVLPLITRYAAAVSYQALSCSDDDIAYFPFVARMLQTGSLLEPFSLRRLAGYGGQTFLQSLSVAVGAENNAYLVDRGVSVIVCFGLVIGFFRERGHLDALAYVVALLLVVLLPFPMLNSASHITGLALFLTLFRTLQATQAAGPSTTGYLWLAGLTVAGAASLRAHFPAAAALTVIAYWSIRSIHQSDQWQAHLRACIVTGAASLAALAPWMIGLWQSSGTFLYPLFRGNHRPNYDNYAAPLGFDEHLEFIGGVLISPGIALFSVPVILYLIRRPSHAALALYGASLLTVAVLTWMFTYSDAQNIHRYAAPFLNAAFIATVAVFVLGIRQTLPTTPEAARKRRWGDIILCSAVVFLLPVMVNKDIQRLANHWQRDALPAASRAIYKRLQAAAPAGAGLFAVVSHPYALDYQRNHIAGVDVPGAASPDPGMPFFKGPEALKTYLKTQGLTYIVHRDFARAGGCLYDRRLWTQNETGTNYREGRFQARYYLDLMDNIDALAKTEKVVRRDHGLTLLNLR